MTFAFIDVVFIVIMILCGIICASKGFIKEVFGKGAIVLGIWFAILFYKKLVPYVSKYINFKFLSIAVSFLLIFLVVYLVMMILRQLVSSFFENEIFTSLDKVLGFVFGILEGLAVVAVILIILSGQTWFDVSKLLDSSVIYRMLKGLIAVPVQEFSNIVDPEKIVPLGKGGNA